MTGPYAKKIGPYVVAAALLAAVIAWLALSFAAAGGRAPLALAMPYEPVAVADVLTSEECARLIENAAPRLARSKTMGDVVSAIRTSEQAWIDASDPTVGDVARKVRARAAQLTGVFRPDLFEQLQVVRYGAGQEYRPHLDACVEGCDRVNQPRINRRATLLVYLTDDFEAGSTHFPAIGTRVRPRRGDGVLFYNTDADTGGELPDSLHAGEPVTAGTKWVANCWVRSDPAATRV
jgi:prolyl 4-hydroxylase